MGMRMRGRKSRVISLSLAIIMLTAVFYGCRTAEGASSDIAYESSAGSLPDHSSFETALNSDLSASAPSAASQNEPGNTESESAFEIEIVFEQAQAFIETPLLSDLSTYEIIRIYPAGSVFYIMEYETPLWVYVQSEDGNEGFLYSDDLHPLDESGAAASEPLGQIKIAGRLDELHEHFPSGYYWNHIGYDEGDVDYSEYITSFSCDHNVTGTYYCNHYNGATFLHYPEYDELYQCLAFASLISDQIFGTEAGISIYNDTARLRLGDHIRLHDYEHSMTVVSIDSDAVTVTEVNENYNDCAISWERRIPISELQSLSWDSEYLTRYPTFRDDAGNLLTNGNTLSVLADITV